MEHTHNPVAFPRMVGRGGYLLSVLCITVLGAVAVYPFLRQGRLEDILFSVFMGLGVFGIDALLLLCVLPTVTVSAHSITLSIGKLVLKKLTANDIQTVVKVCIRGRHPVVMMRVISTPAAEIEERGEEKLRKKLLAKEEIGFRKTKSDWPDVCLGEGLRKTGGLWIEFTPERQELLLELFPQAEYRVGKHFNDPPSLV